MTANIYMSMEGVEVWTPPKMLAEHAGEIPLLSCTWGATNSTHRDEVGNIVDLKDIQVTKLVDPNSVYLLKLVSKGVPVSSVSIKYYKQVGAGAEVFLTITLEDVFVKKVMSGMKGSANDHMEEEVSLAYGQIRIEYCPDKEDGTLDGAIITSVSTAKAGT